MRSVAEPQKNVEPQQPDALHDARPALEDSHRFHFAVVSDTHIIDTFYKPGSENGVEDNTTILQANDHLITARTALNKLRFADGSRIEQVFVPGDVFHNYPSTDYDFYFKNETRLDIANKLLSGFDAPVHVGWGNHDYDIGHISREMSHRLFEAKFKTKPYWSMEHKGFRFIMLNNFLGVTCDPTSPSYHRDYGSLGEEQLQWLEAQLAERRPSVIFIHYPLWSVAPVEMKDFGLHPLLRRYRGDIQIVIAGHWHKWIDFAHTYGPQHTVVGSTRYDEHSYMVFEADAREGEIRWLDQSRVRWSTHYADPLPLG
ncbi:metallophosphoesterase family protein [Granulicella cerasi]|nr:metallophosphoesterase [Granulicella cerasi]